MDPKLGKVTIILEDVDGIPFSSTVTVDKSTVDGSLSENTLEIMRKAIESPSSIPLENKY